MTHITLESMAQQHREHMRRIFDVMERVRDVHPLLAQPWPIALVEDDTFFIFDALSPRGPYAPVKQARAPMPIPDGVRAAFPLEAYEGRPACVVSGDIFDSLDGYATLMHEFVHCHQWQTVEPALRDRLLIARQAQARNDPMWELNHPFPYTDPTFVETYASFLDAAQRQDLPAALRCWAQLKRTLQSGDYEYLVWQAWKEGFARWVENGVRRSLGLNENHGSAQAPFSRVSFYEGGARLIDLLNTRDLQLARHLDRLFERMLEPQA
jgi:hypothetical protein